MIISAVRKFGFDAAHRLLEHEGKCAYLHGHRYTAHLYFSRKGGSLDAIGRVMDFSEMQVIVGTWIDRYWDHNTILNYHDPLVKVVQGFCKDGQPSLLPYNPTAENLGVYLLGIVCPGLFKGKGAEVVKVVVEETPNCRAEIRRDNNESTELGGDRKGG